MTHDGPATAHDPAAAGRPPVPPRRDLTLVALFAIAALVYLNTLTNGFVIDDVSVIVENDWVTGPRYLPEIFARGVWDFEGRTSSYYRPLMYVAYMAVHVVAGRSPWAYHLLGVLLHACATVLVAMLARRVFAREDGQAPAWLAPAFVAGLLFAVHPIHTEPVAWVASIADLGFTVFGLLAIWWHATARARSWGRDLASAVAWLLALLFKETAVVIPLIAAAYDLTFVDPRQRTARLLRGVWLSLAVAAVYLGLRVNALGALTPSAEAGLTASRYGLAVLALLAGYVEKLLWPAGLNVWHSFVPPPSLASTEALTDLAVVACTAVGLGMAARANRVARFAAVLLTVPLLPSFHVGVLNQGLEHAFAERYLYLPSAGFVLLAALAVDSLRARQVVRPPVLLAGVLLVAGTYATVTVARNRVWHDSLSLWSDAVSKSPGNAAAHMSYGAALIYAGRQEQGVAEMRRAAAMSPALVERELGKANAYRAKGLHKKALLTLHTALVMAPGHAPVHYNLALVYEAMGQPAAAADEYARALALDPDFADAHNNLGVLHAQRGDMERALAHFQAAVRLRPDDPDYRANLERARRR